MTKPKSCRSPGSGSGSGADSSSHGQGQGNNGNSHLRRRELRTSRRSNRRGANEGGKSGPANHYIRSLNKCPPKVKPQNCGEPLPGSTTSGKSSTSEGSSGKRKPWKHGGTKYAHWRPKSCTASSRDGGTDGWKLRKRNGCVARSYNYVGTTLFLSSRDIQLGRGEPIADMARVLSRMCDGIMIRTFAHAEVEEIARHADIPVINGLTDLSHPCQILADLLTVRQFLGRYQGKRVAWIGDGNNMANSWIEAAQRLDFSLTLACPVGYDPDPVILGSARAEGADVTLVRDPREAAEGAHVINTDVWATMGQEDEQAVRAKAFAGYMVDEALMRRASKGAIFLHCLPAHRGEEVAAEVIEGPQSRVWAEAENRLHIQKAIMAVLMGGEKLVAVKKKAKKSVARKPAAKKSLSRRASVKQKPRR